MAGPFDHFAGDLTPGQTGWLPLDADGNPTGPATKDPPPAPAFACSVMVNPAVPLPEGQHLLLSSTGADLSAPLQSNVDKRLPGTDAPTPPQSISLISLNPNSCSISDPDFVLEVIGTGFASDSVIHFAGHDEPTTFLSSTTLTTGVKPTLWQNPVVVQCSVKHGSGETPPLDFEFLPAEGATRQTRRK